MVAKAQSTDPVQFGRWVSERRRALGWSSQKALADAAARDPVTSESDITENFVARIEAGVLAWPPRGSVRRRVLELAWFLCATPRAVASYLRLAGCTQLSDEERELVERISAQIAASTSDVPLLLPPQPRLLIGREQEVAELLDQITSLDGGCCAVTGLVGVGKSALAAEVVHRLAQDRRRRAYHFPDGIIALSMARRRGITGVIELLQEVEAVCAHDAHSATVRVVPRARAASADQLPESVNQVRYLLTGKRLLILLDDVEPQFPLGEALQALLSVRASTEAHDLTDRRGRITVLLTTRTVPDPALTNAHLRLAPLQLDASLALFSALAERPLDTGETILAGRLCARLAHLPLAIEQAASAMRVEGIPIQVLGQLVEQRPLDPSWRGGKILRERLTSAVQPLEGDAHLTFTMLPLLGSYTFTLRAAALLHSEPDTAQTPAEQMALDQMQVSPIEAVVDGVQPENMGAGPLDRSGDVSFAAPAEYSPASCGHWDEEPAPLAHTASVLGQLVRHSLLELVAGAGEHDRALTTSAELASSQDPPRYAISPLVHRFAVAELGNLHPAQQERALTNLLAYAQDIAHQLPSTEEEFAAEWPVVRMAFMWALGRDAHREILDLAGALAHSTPTMLRFGRQTRFIMSEAIVVARRTDNRLALARLLNRFGVFHYYQGALAPARQAWTESAQVVESLPAAQRFGSPYHNLAALSIQMRAFGAAREYIECGLKHVEASSQYIDGTQALVGLYAARAETFRKEGVAERALAELVTAEQLLATRGPEASGWRSCWRRELEVERIRALGHYDQARAVACDIATGDAPSIGTAHIALDHADYAAQLGLLDDARAFALQAARLGRHLRSRFFIAQAHGIVEHLPAHTGT